MHINMFMLMSACLYVALSIPLIDASCNLPFTKRCKRNDPKLAKCWSSVLEEAPQYLTYGIPEFGLPPIEPWRSPDSYVLNGTTYNVDHKYMEHNGTKNFQIIENTIKLSANRITLTLRFPKLDHVCTTVPTGTFFNFKLSGTESCHEGKADATIFFDLKGERVTKNGKEHIEFNDIVVKVQGIYTKSKFHGMAAGSRQQNILFDAAVEKGLGAVFTVYMNECVQKSLGLDIARAIKNIYSNCPLDILHPLE